MSKNISIKEDNQSRNFTSKKLKIATQSDGSSLWVPKDEVKLKTLSIRTPGIYQAWVDEAYGYSKVNVSGLRKGSDTKRTDKSVTENGTYKAEDDHFYAYNTFTVNVAGGGGTAPPSDKPGSSVYGTYPDGTQGIIAVDNEGNLIKSGLAEYILLDTPPTKMKYKDGERILLGGAVVRGYLANGTPYKNASYQDSILPLYQGGDQESGSDDYLPGGVVFPTPRYAQKSESPFPSLNVISISGFDVTQRASGYTYHRNTVTLGVVNEGASGWVPGASIYLATRTANEEGTVLLTKYNGNVYAYGVNLTETGGRGWAFLANLNSVVHVYNGGWHSVHAGSGTFTFSNIPESYEDPTQAEERETQTITLNWPREGDRKILTTTYEIEVTP